MERRDFMRLGGTLGVATLGGGVGCLPGFLPKRVPDAEMKKILGQMDANLERVSRYDMLDDFSRRAGTGATYTEDDRLLSRQSMRSLYTAAMFRNLPEEAQLHPAMQERVFAQLPEMDEAVFGMTDRMSTLTDTGRELVSERLHDKRTEPEQISKLFDQGMGTLEMPLGRRFQMRSIFSQVGWRMQKQPGLVIDEYVTKVSKATALIGSEVELQRRIAAQMGQDAYWRHQNTLALMLADDPGGPGGGGPPGAPPGTGPLMPRTGAEAQQEVSLLMANVRLAASKGQCEAVEFLGNRIATIDPEAYRSTFMTDAGVIECKVTRARMGIDRARIQGPVEDCDNVQAIANKRARSKVIGTGGWMLGIGLITGVLGAVSVGLGEGGAVIGAIGLTVGVALLVGGLIVLIVGAGMAET